MNIEIDKSSNRLVTLSNDILFTIINVLRKGCKKVENHFDEDKEFEDLFYEYKNYTISEIISELSLYREDYISFEVRQQLLDRNILKEYLTLLAILGRVIINDVIGGEDTYRLVPRNLIDSSFTRGYYNISLRNIERVLLVADTHIGSDEFEDLEMINNVFKYAKDSYGIDTVIHLGDVFDGIRLDKGKYLGYTLDSSEVQKKLNEQLEKFQDRFPDYMKVIALEGNHDTSIIKYLETMNYLGHNLNQLYLTLLKPNFHMLSERKNAHIISAPNMRISLSHPLSFNVLFPYVKTYEIESENVFISTLKKQNPLDIDLLLSGHFHYSMHYSITDDNDITRRIFEVVPSLSKKGLSTNDKCISKILRFIYDEEGNITHYGITPLYFSNSNLIEKEEVVYKTNMTLMQENSKVYSKKM